VSDTISVAAALEAKLFVRVQSASSEFRNEKRVPRARVETRAFNRVADCLMLESVRENSPRFLCIISDFSKLGYFGSFISVTRFLELV